MKRTACIDSPETVRRVLPARGQHNHHMNKSKITTNPVFTVRQDEWNKSYLQRRWDYLKSSDERSRYAILAGWIRAYNCAGSILDVGCGEGNLCRDVDGCKVYCGIDLSFVALQRAEGNAVLDSRFVLGDIESYQPDRQYDAIVFNEVLYYLRDPIGAMNRLSKYKSTTGIMLVSVFVSNLSPLWVDLVIGSRIWDEQVTIANKRGTWICCLSTEQ
jgi:2-polyprenyl-3-methyl-5-hydroxy-6-metoxy-1,4-benzoquinol methylase